MQCYCVCSVNVLIYSLTVLCLHLFILMTDSPERLLMPAGECLDYLIQPWPTAANNSICFTFPEENKTFKPQSDGCVTVMIFLRCSSDTESSCDLLVIFFNYCFFALTLRPSLAWQLTLSGVSKAISFSSFPLLQICTNKHRRQVEDIHHHKGLETEWHKKLKTEGKTPRNAETDQHR